MSLKDEMEKLKSRLLKLDKVLEVSIEGNTCGFCNKVITGVLPGVVSSVSGSVVCAECLMYMRQASGELPVGAVACLRCNSYDSMTVTYPNASVQFVFGGLDKDLGVVYIVQQASAAWSRSAQPTKMTCNTCLSKIPLWVLQFNKYARPAV